MGRAGRYQGIPGAVLGLSRDDLKAWLGAGLGDEALSNPPRALTPDAWEIMLRAVGRKHGCTLSDRALTTVATRLHEQLPETVREMLKQGGPALNGMLLLLLGDIHSAVCRTLDEKLDKLAASADQLSSLLGILQRAATTLSQRLEGIPDRAFLIAQFEQQSEESAWLIAALVAVHQCSYAYSTLHRARTETLRGCSPVSWELLHGGLCEERRRPLVVAC